MQYHERLWAIARYAAGVGVAEVTDGQGNVATMGEDIPRDRLDPDHFGALAPIELHVGSFTLRLRPAPGMLPRAVAKRVEGCTRLLRVMARVPPPDAPPGEGGGGPGPASAELRVWPPGARARR